MVGNAPPTTHSPLTFQLPLAAAGLVQEVPGLRRQLHHALQGPAGHPGQPAHPALQYHVAPRHLRQVLVAQGHGEAEPPAPSTLYPLGATSRLGRTGAHLAERVRGGGGTLRPVLGLLGHAAGIPALLLQGGDALCQLPQPSLCP